MPEFAPQQPSAWSRFVDRMTVFAEAMEANPVAELTREVMRLEMRVIELESRSAAKTRAGE